MKIIASLQVKLTEGEYPRVLAKGTRNLEAYLKCLKAIPIFRRVTKENNQKARRMFEEVTALDHNFPHAYMYLGWTHALDVQNRWTKSPKESLARAEELARKAIELDESLGGPHRLLGNIYRSKGQWDKALEEKELAVSLDPIPVNFYGLAGELNFAGKREESIALYKKAFRLDPIPPAAYIFGFGISYFMAERYEDALVQFQRLLDRESELNPLAIHRGLAATYAMLGQKEEARKHVAQMLEINPKVSVKSLAFLQTLYRNQADGERFTNALRKAGLPE